MENAILSCIFLEACEYRQIPNNLLSFLSFLCRGSQIHDALTSIEQKIHKMRFWMITKADEPNPRAR